LKEIFQVGPLEKGFTDDALRETEDAVRLALDSQEPVELAPQNSYVRRLQHQLVERYDLLSESVGVEPRRRVRILPNP
jgi:predicted RNA-binding protein Jag